MERMHRVSNALSALPGAHKVSIKILAAVAFGLQPFFSERQDSLLVELGALMIFWPYLRLP